MPGQTMTIRQRTAQLLEANRSNDPLARAVDIFLITLILANVLFVTLETLPLVQQKYADIFWHIEVISVSIFTIEYLLRLWSCVDTNKATAKSPLKTRVRWIFSPLGFIDLIAIVPFYVFLFIPSGYQSLLVLRLFRGVRLLRIFKLTRYSPALQVLRTVIRKESRTLTVVAFLLLVILIVAAFGIYVLERDHQPEVFGSVPHALWWAVVSLTTVGYGDVVPITALGKVFAGVIALVGIGTMALPAGIMAAAFSSEMRRREQEYDRAVHLALADGQVSEHETIELEVLRTELGMTEEEAHDIMLDAKRRSSHQLKCPHCGMPSAG